MKFVSNQNPNPGDLPKPPDNLPPGDDPKPEIREPEPSEQPGRPTPSGVPNEIRAGYEYLGEGVYEYKPVRLRSGWFNERKPKSC